MKYFAYGSNMLRERLLKRVPGATVIGLASVRGRILRFQKKSSDGSAKCDLATTQCYDDQAWGVLFEIPDAQIAVLDDAEGLGKGYAREPIQVRREDGQVVESTAYLATPDAVVPNLQPYEWYRNLVVTGARQNNLPAAYIAALEATPAIPDPLPRRKTRLEALEVLAAAGRQT
ncbi:MAG: gamma-glutamylcyclotransferase [Verrucomicrobia bacterium]|nr:gamma-glutamylcyclotransferase [Verrucomicrobiota bacterium]